PNGNWLSMGPRKAATTSSLPLGGADSGGPGAAAAVAPRQLSTASAIPVMVFLIDMSIFLLSPGAGKLTASRASLERRPHAFPAQLGLLAFDLVDPVEQGAGIEPHGQPVQVGRVEPQV